MRPNALRRTIAMCAFFSACLTPFWFGTVDRSQWIPLWQLWLGLGFLSSVLERMGSPRVVAGASVAVSRALLPLHALFALQLLPLPKSVLAWISPGSFAAHFLPDPGDVFFRPVTVSPGATIEAWLYVAGLQGLFLALRGIPAEKRRTMLYWLLAAIGVLAAEGLWQSRSDHPYWPYAWVPVSLPSGFETGLFGPYLNRNHFATVMAMGCGLSAGLATALVKERGGLRAIISHSAPTANAVLLVGASFSFLVTSVASGSRSGTLAAIVSLGLLSARSIGKGPILIVLSLALGALAVSGGAAMERLQRLDIFVSRLKPWADMSGLLQHFPVFGSGLGTFAVAYWPYQTNVTYEFWQHAHNDYLQALVEGGLIGLVVALLLIFRLRATLAPAANLRDALLGATGAFATQSLFDFPSHVPANAAILVSVLALTLAAKRGETRRDN